MATAERTRFPIMMLLALASAEMITSVELSMIYVAMPKIVAQYGSPTKAYWVITIYLIVATASVTLASRVGDLIGRKKVLVGILCTVLAGSLVSAFTTSYAGLLTGRAMMGFIAAAIPLCFGLIREHFPAGKVAMGVGLAAAIPSMGGVTAMLVAGIVIDNFPWRTVFFFSSGFTALATLLVFFVIPKDHAVRSKPVIDWLGGIIMLGAILCLLGALNMGKIHGWLTAWPLGLLAASLALWAVWIFHELRHRAPLVDLKLLSRRKVFMTNLVMLLLAVGTIQSPGVISLVLQQPEWTIVGFGLAATTYGLLHMPLAGTNFVAGMLSGYLCGKNGARNAALAGTALCTLCWALIAMHHSNLVLFIAVFYTAVFGFSIVYSAIPNLIIEDAPETQTSGQTGVTTFVRYLGNAIGSQIIALTMSFWTLPDPSGAGKPFISDQAITTVFWMITGLTFVALILVWAIAPGARSLRKQAVAA